MVLWASKRTRPTELSQNEKRLDCRWPTICNTSDNWTYKFTSNPVALEGEVLDVPHQKQTRKNKRIYGKGKSSQIGLSHQAQLMDLANSHPHSPSQKSLKIVKSTVKWFWIFEIQWLNAELTRPLIWWIFGFIMLLNVIEFYLVGLNEFESLCFSLNVRGYFTPLSKAQVPFCTLVFVYLLVLHANCQFISMSTWEG